MQAQVDNYYRAVGRTQGLLLFIKQMTAGVKERVTSKYRQLIVLRATTSTQDYVYRAFAFIDSVVLCLDFSGCGDKSNRP